MIPTASATIITAKAHLQLLDEIRLSTLARRTSPGSTRLELARVCGEGRPHHWGATTQNILETGDAHSQNPVDLSATICTAV